MKDKIMVLVTATFDIGSRYYSYPYLTTGISQAASEFECKENIKQLFPDAYNIQTSSKVLSQDFLQKLKDYLNN